MSVSEGECESERERKTELKHSVQDSQDRKEREKKFLTQVDRRRRRDGFFNCRPQNKTISRVAKHVCRRRISRLECFALNKKS